MAKLRKKMICFIRACSATMLRRATETLIARMNLASQAKTHLTLISAKVAITRRAGMKKTKTMMKVRQASIEKKSGKRKKLSLLQSKRTEG